MSLASSPAASSALPVLLATQGLLFAELLHLSPYTPEERTRLVAALLRAADQRGKPSTTSHALKTCAAAALLTVLAGRAGQLPQPRSTAIIGIRRATTMAAAPPRYSGGDNTVQEGTFGANGCTLFHSQALDQLMARGARRQPTCSGQRALRNAASTYKGCSAARCCCPR